MDDSENKVTRRASTQDVSWFIDCNSVQQLELSPVYQRKSVWTLKDRRFFLDTIFRGYPCPPIYLHKTFKEGKSIYSVVDGKQRLETIIKFFNNQISLAQNFGDERLNGKKWRHIKDNQELASRFMDYVFPVEFISLPFDQIAYVNDVFDRLNRNAKLLNSQELRHAKYTGWFISFVEEDILYPFWEKCKISTKARNKRMTDIQFLSELLICVMNEKIIGFDQEIIDVYYSTYDDLDEFDPDNEWDLPEIDPGDIASRYQSVRNAIENMADGSCDFMSCLKDNKTFYSVWTYLVQANANPALPPFSVDKFLSLLKEVDKLKKVSEAELAELQIAPAVINYNEANKGATTELPEREARFNAMKAWFGEESC